MIRLRLLFISCSMIHCVVSPGLGQTSSKFVSLEKEPVYDANILRIRSDLAGIAQPTQRAVLRVAQVGNVMAWHVQEGQSVEAGAPILTLDNRRASAAVEVAERRANQTAAVTAAELELKRAKRSLQRLRSAHAQNAASDFELEAKENELAKASALLDQQREIHRQLQAELKVARAELELLTIHAPFSGVVVHLHAKVGNSVGPDEPAVTLAKLDELEVELYLPISMFGKIQKGQQHAFLAAAPVNSKLSGSVNFASPVIESTSGTFRCVFRIPNPQHELPAGFSIRLADPQ